MQHSIRRVSQACAIVLLLLTLSPNDIRSEEINLSADNVIRDPNGTITATGSVIIESPKARVEADRVRMDINSGEGELEHATIIQPDGERIYFENIQRTDTGTYRGDSIYFTTCPPDNEAWGLRAASAEYDPEEGLVTARHARFELAGIPLIYSPYWQQPMRRKSGLLLPEFHTGKRRGTEFGLPIYWAVAPDWDITLTPYNMSARGFMPKLELRHASEAGSELLNLEGINDRVVSNQRSRISGQIDHSLGWNVHFMAKGEHISDHGYLADLSSDPKDAARSFLQSTAGLYWHGQASEWKLYAANQQNLLLPNDKSTLQILPRFESSSTTTETWHGIIPHFDQQSTRFMRKIGVDGWRADLHPYLEIPMQAYNGALRSTATLGGHFTRYWLQDTANNRTPSRSSYEASLETSTVFERISDDQLWRHTIEPTLRYDYIQAPDQATLPNFDSALSTLSMSNLLSGNRFSGHDRIEKANRISFLLGTRLETKDSLTTGSRQLLQMRAGVSYDIRPQQIDPALQPMAVRPYSNLLTDLVWTPWTPLRISASGQYNPVGHFWTTSSTALAWHAESGHLLEISHQYTDARYANPVSTLTGQLNLRVASRWDLHGQAVYDRLLKLMQESTAGIRYTHPCWNFDIEGYRTYRADSTGTTKADYGFHFLIEFKSLGSVGT